jgi:hypothetical protein
VYIFTPLFLFWIMWHSLSLSLSMIDMSAIM